MTTANPVATRFLEEEPMADSPRDPLPHHHQTVHQDTPTDNPPAYNETSQHMKPTLGERFHKLSSKAGWPLNKAANVIGAEAWWPNSVEKESIKAARILYSFTANNGLFRPRRGTRPPRANGPIHPTGITAKSMVKIPRQVLQNCAGLAIFNTIRAGAWHGSFSGGSGVVLARRADGTWSPPSSFVVSGLGAGFMLGLDVCDCVCVLHTAAQVKAFTRSSLTLGGGASVAVGPVGGGGAVKAAVGRKGRPVWSYIKSRGLWAGIQVDGTVFVTRNDANAVFYNRRGITANAILTGDDVAWPVGAKPLFEVLRAIDGRADFDRGVVDQIAKAPPPGDVPMAETMGQTSLQPAVHSADHVHVEKRDVKERPDKARRKESENIHESSIHESSVLDEKERLARSGY
ncbi:SH3 domain-containing protein-like protein [Hapsidospora chrysogenum ATCC 11550]|uniref:SH3 domain-containing protein-like protein n=1 Tax=Hapsidospora chrysogenum (strain ATCC 11550 / CBS 779.69 / DSM 880 / IAM 14645 / JCM 23072 / IMI 49137) TaxID=857340 RepID=A0A086T7L2_HAPC1|nr:SH3 domain-containing protein-like protein [Hapsidospora chrysogenum ATCC 11550]